MRGSSNGLTLIEIFRVPPFFTSEASTLLGAAKPSKPYAVAVVAPSAVAYAKNSLLSRSPFFASSA